MLKILPRLSRVVVPIILIILFSLTFAAAQPVQAATFTVGTGSAASCNENALRQTMRSANQNGGGTINFNCGGGNHTILMTRQIAFGKANAEIVVNGGNSITLDAQRQSRHFYIREGRSIHFTIRNINLINGRAIGDASGSRPAGQGGAIFSGYKNNLTVENVTFRDNIAPGKAQAWHGGGAIRIDSESIANISNSQFIGNRGNSGGAINNLISRLTITNSQFIDNRARDNRGGGGGAIYNDMGWMTIDDSEFTENRARNLGGGIYTYAANAQAKWYSGRVRITNSLITGNRTTNPEGNGGGIFHANQNPLIIRESTISNNIAGRNGAGLFVNDTKRFNLINSTVSGNRLPDRGVGAGLAVRHVKSMIRHTTIAYNFIGSESGSHGAGIHQTNSNVTLRNTIIAHNQGGIRNCAFNYNNGGGNLQFPGNSCGSNIRVADPLLGPLNNNGGPTPTHELLPGSPAISKGNRNHCLPRDQRGVDRPQGDRCDIGAFERQGSSPTSPLVLFPAQGAEVSNSTPTLRWAADDNTEVYRVVVRMIQPNKRLIHRVVDNASAFNCGSSECSLDLDSAGITLRSGRTYRLIIQARNDFGRTPTRITFQAE